MTTTPKRGRWVGNVDLLTASTASARDFGYHPLLVGEALSHVTTTLREEHPELGRHYEHLFNLRVDNGPGHAPVEYPIAAITLEREPMPAWVSLVQPGRMVEVLFGSLAEIARDEIGRLIPTAVAHYAWAVRVFVPEDEVPFHETDGYRALAEAHVD